MLSQSMVKTILVSLLAAALWVFPTLRVMGQEEPPIVTSFSDGRLIFEDPSAEGEGAYQVEWSSDLQAWFKSWAGLALVPSDGSPTQVTVPRFFRVRRLYTSGALPEAVTDADYFDGGTPDMAKVTLGKFLFWDKILSGNRNVSCATCHHSMAGTGDGLSLSLGEGAAGVGVMRTTPAPGEDGAVPERVPRNAPHIFNLGAIEFTTMFHDGRVVEDDTHAKGFATPAGDDLLSGLDNALAAQAVFPVTSGTEMAGQPPENDIANLAAAGDLPALWSTLAARVKAIPEYVSMCIDAYPEVSGSADITFAHVANAIAAYEAWAGRADNSPFDRYLRGETAALSAKQVDGMQLFYGKADCASCHSGKFQTDHQFHAVAIPQIGPGKGHGASGHEDFGREDVTGVVEDRYKFRTPSLRNVALTGPWGHSGAYDSLEAVVRHMLDPVAGLNSYDRTQAVLPSRPDLEGDDFIVMDDPELVNSIAGASEPLPVVLGDDELESLIAFLHALTDPRSMDLRDIVPLSVPSGLPVSD